MEPIGNGSRNKLLHLDRLKSEQEALDMVEKIKATYIAPSKEVIYEETI